MSSPRNRDSGFTLVELLIVIVILGILAAIVVFAVTGIVNKGQTSACDSDKKTLQVAEEAQYAKSSTGAAPGWYGSESYLVNTGKTLAGVSKLYNISIDGTPIPESVEVTGTAYTIVAEPGKGC